MRVLEMLEQEILKVVKTITPQRRGVYASEVVRRLPPRCSYSKRTVERAMRRLFEAGSLVKVGQRQGYMAVRQ